MFRGTGTLGLDQECTPDLDERSSGNPQPGRVSFAPGVCNFVVHLYPVGRVPRLMSLGVGRRRCR